MSLPPGLRSLPGTVKRNIMITKIVKGIKLGIYLFVLFSIVFMLMTSLVNVKNCYGLMIFAWILIALMMTGLHCAIVVISEFVKMVMRG